ncbi:MAG: flagellar protein, partial [Firmicutes bacterium]|nr:flagellar protein [Bacillota bacterium]
MNREFHGILTVGPLPVPPVKGRPAAGSLKNGNENKAAFEKALQKELEKSGGLKFSAHAEKRLKERNIVLAPEDQPKLDLAVKQAESRGARESLI